MIEIEIKQGLIFVQKKERIFFPFFYYLIFDFKKIIPAANILFLKKRQIFKTV